MMPTSQAEAAERSKPTRCGGGVPPPPLPDEPYARMRIERSFVQTILSPAALVKAWRLATP